ncbi:D-aminoacyl-tRNA deacylase [Cutibacterium sp.]|uniref:D-aminoacyl-tRNA deacylase n=1 Tax=Cutibacterium sp. TaxID=1912221 RepID=UPI0026DC5902|nr:D-aminoacyl-tRNA deacylase [Cutibacterium sp.]MDO4412827.1 D-aminoacyl-tRNA deacylase [Cutibacterium sp.]
MRVVIQRASSAQVDVEGQTVGTLASPGLVVLVGVTGTDTIADAEKLAEKIWNLRILADEKSASDIDAPVLVVSQFTLYASTRKGRRPSWNAAAPGSVSEPLVNHFVSHLRELGAHVETGIFGADMKVSLVNDGPMTILIDTDDWR